MSLMTPILTGVSSFQFYSNFISNLPYRAEFSGQTFPAELSFFMQRQQINFSTRVISSALKK